MPRINRPEFEKAEAKVGGGGGFAQMEPGVYELYIQAIRTEWDTKNGHTRGLEKQCVKIVWDVASGEFANNFSDAYFVDWDGNPDPELDYRHSTILSWKNYDYLKGRFDALNAANPAFDALAAFDAIPDDAYDPKQWGAFVGKRFWAVIDGELKLNKNGYDTWLLDVGAWITPEMVRSGDFPEPRITDSRKGGSQQGDKPALASQGATYAV